MDDHPQTRGKFCVKPPPLARLKLTVRGAVQGVGFRPFVHRLATGLGLAGWVNNSCEGVSLEVEGPRPQVESFLLRLEAEKPPRSSIQSLEASWLDAAGYRTFEIKASENGGESRALVSPDIATCSDCLKEIFDARNRRYLYPFTNCTNCGPRFSLIEALPYDRANTAMKQFALCPQCRAEFENPLDRRFHAQPNACPVCGPQLQLWNRSGQTLRTGQEALVAAAAAIRQGGIVALKGLGGFHLITPACDDAAVRRMRELKHREEKPFAVMFPSLAAARRECEISPLEERLLC
jgi:hydrogenase maturation protein HypF